MATKLKNVSILTAGEAKGHNLLIDETSLQQALAVAQSMGRIKVTNGHGAQQGVEAADDPDSPDQPRVTQFGGNQPGSPQDAGTDRAPDRSRQAKAQPQHVLQPARAG